MHEQNRAGRAVRIDTAFFEHEQLHIAVFAGPMLFATNVGRPSYVVHRLSLAPFCPCTLRSLGPVADWLATSAGRETSRDCRRAEWHAWRLSRKLTCTAERCDAQAGTARLFSGQSYAPLDFTLPCTFLGAALRVAASGLQ